MSQRVSSRHRLLMSCVTAPCSQPLDSVSFFFIVMYGVLLTRAPSFDRYHIPYKEKQVLCMETESEKISEPGREWDLAMGELCMQKALSIFAVTQ